MYSQWFHLIYSRSKMSVCQRVLNRDISVHPPMMSYEPMTQCHPDNRLVIEGSNSMAHNPADSFRYMPKMTRYQSITPITKQKWQGIEAYPDNRTVWTDIGDYLITSGRVSGYHCTSVSSRDN